MTAIDILLNPDATMMKHSDAVNARLRSVYPKGFALDATHRPHITLLQRFVRTADLDQVYAAANKVLAGVKASDLQLKAIKYYYIPAGDLGLSGIVAEPTPELLKLQQELVDAVAPFTVPTGTAGAFFTTPKEPNIQPALITYVAAFVPTLRARSSIRTSPLVSPPKSIWTRCWPSRLSRSPSHRRARPSISSAISGRRRRNSRIWNCSIEPRT